MVAYGSTDEAVDVATRFAAYNGPEVAVMLVPLKYSRELRGKDVLFVPPLEMGSVPEMLARVVVACQVGVPL